MKILLLLLLTAIQASAYAQVEADLALTLKAAPNPVKAGEKLIYTITITNNGPDAADDVTLTNSTPTDAPPISVISSHGECVLNTCKLGSLLPGAEATVVLYVYPPTAGEVRDSVTITSSTEDPSAGNNIAEVVTSVLAPVPPHIDPP